MIVSRMRLSEFGIVGLKQGTGKIYLVFGGKIICSLRRAGGATLLELMVGYRIII